MSNHIQEREWIGDEEPNLQERSRAMTNEDLGKRVASRPEKNSPALIWGGVLVIFAIIGISLLFG